MWRIFTGLVIFLVMLVFAALATSVWFTYTLKSRRCPHCGEVCADVVLLHHHRRICPVLQREPPPDPY